MEISAFNMLTGEEEKIDVPVIGHIGETPLVGIKMMSDEKWNELAAESRRKNPELYENEKPIKENKRSGNMNELQIFNNPEFGEMRTVTINNEPWFVGKDVADILGYTNPQKAIRDHVDEDEKLTERIVLSGQNREIIVINERGLYSLILSSKLKGAKKFKRWVTAEVLPAIRKTGGYVHNDDAFINTYLPFADESTKVLFKGTLKAIRGLNEQIDRNRPKVVFADAVTASKTSILVGELAKLMKQNGIQIGEKRLFAWLRDNGYLIKRKGTDYNSPTQRSMELSLFEVKETAITHSDGHTTINKTTKVTGKGQQYFINKFMAGQEKVV